MQADIVLFQHPHLRGTKPIQQKIGQDALHTQRVLKHACSGSCNFFCRVDIFYCFDLETRQTQTTRVSLKCQAWCFPYDDIVSTSPRVSSRQHIQLTKFRSTRMQIAEICSSRGEDLYRMFATKLPTVLLFRMKFVVQINLSRSRKKRKSMLRLGYCVCFSEYKRHLLWRNTRKSKRLSLLISPDLGIQIS